MRKTIHSDEHGTIEYKQVPVQDGDLVVVKAGMSQGAVDDLAAHLGLGGKPNSLVVVVEKLSDIKTLSQEQMARYGWHRADRLKAVTKYLESKIGEDDDLRPIYDGIYFMVTGRYYEQESA